MMRKHEAKLPPAKQQEFRIAHTMDASILHEDEQAWSLQYSTVLIGKKPSGS